MVLRHVCAFVLIVPAKSFVFLLLLCCGFFFFFFFQAEDGIRDHCVTGSSDVCSSDLPIWRRSSRRWKQGTRRSLEMDQMKTKWRIRSPETDWMARTARRLRRLSFTRTFTAQLVTNQIGRASCRERV